MWLSRFFAGSTLLYLWSWEIEAVISNHLSDQRTAHPSTLYIVVDDLRAGLPPYVQEPRLHVPNVLRLASGGLTFTHAYCQQPVCGPSRNSFMSGRRPDQTRSWNFKNDFREVGPDWTTLPSHFKSHGYLTLGTGKLYHEGLPPNGDGNLSWTDIPLQFDCHNSSAQGAGTYCDPKMPSCTTTPDPSSGVPHPRWCVEEDTGFFADNATLGDARRKLDFAARHRRETGQPFFLGVGLRKPHLDWRVPRAFLDLYPEEVPLARHQTAPDGLPPIAYHSVWRSDAEKRLWEGYGFRSPWVPMRNKTAATMRRFYYAATSFMDHFLGQLLDDLEDLGLDNDTIVCFHSDHGWSLGEGGNWRKFSLTELGTRVPLIIRDPRLPGGHGEKTDSFFELVDVFPTLSELAGLSLPTDRVPLAGQSQASVVAQPRTAPPVKSVAVSQYPRCPVNDSVLWAMNWCIEVDRHDFGWMGYSLRTAGSSAWRYNAWVPWNGTTLTAVWPVRPENGTNGFYHELFDYRGVNETCLDCLDTAEVAAQYPETALHLFQQLKTFVTLESGEALR